MKTKDGYRIGIIQFSQETNSFNPLPSTKTNFEQLGIGHGDEVIEKFGDTDIIRGFRDGLTEWKRPASAVGLFRARSWAAGLLTAEAREWAFRSIEAAIRNAGPLDAVLCGLHGALAAEDDYDVDGSLLELIHSLTGKGVPIAAAFDLHGCLSPNMLKYSSAVTAYRSNPHTDIYETGRRAAALLGMIMQGNVFKPVHRRLPMISISEAQNTGSGPLETIFSAMRGYEKKPGIIDISLFMTQGWLDVPFLGWSCLVTADDEAGGADPNAAEELCEQVLQACWGARGQLKETFYPPEDAVEEALAHHGKPVVIADGSDAFNSGAPGDSTHLLKALLSRHIDGGALTIMIDPEAVARAQEVGPGGRFSLAVGGKRDNVFSQPVMVNGEVLFIKRAAYILNGHGGSNLPVDMGTAAAVKSGTCTVLFVEKPGSGSSPMMYRCVGLEPEKAKIVVVKSPAGFRNEYGPFASRILLCDAPGCASPHYAGLPYRSINRPLWPIDRMQDRSEAGWLQSEIEGEQNYMNKRR